MHERIECVLGATGFAFWGASGPSCWCRGRCKGYWRERSEYRTDNQAESCGGHLACWAACWVGAPGRKLERIICWRGTVCDLPPSGPPLRWRSLVPGHDPTIPGVLGERTQGRGVNRRVTASRGGSNCAANSGAGGKQQLVVMV